MTMEIDSAWVTETLTPEQVQRLLTCSLVADLVRAKMLAGTKVDAMDVVAISTWVITGEDPWPSADTSEIAARLEHITRVVDEMREELAGDPALPTLGDTVG